MLSLLNTILGLALVAQSQAHVGIINIYGSNNQVGHAFGVDLSGKYPRVIGAPGDAGGDSGIFQTGTDNPSPACGGTPELGPLDVPAWLAQAEGFGLPAAYSNMSVVMDVFQVNRDGGGPMSCEYNDDATATSWHPMFMSLNQAGNSGIQNQQRVNSTVVANFPPDATCKGGFTQTACIVRCRTGVNRRFGGCFAVKLSNSESYAGIVSNGTDLNATVISRVTTGGPSDSSAALSDSVINTIAQKVLSVMQSNGLLVSAEAAGSLLNSTLPLPNTNGTILRLVGTNQSAPILGNNTTNASLSHAPISVGTPISPDASDLADAADAADASSPTDAPAASDDTSDASNISDAPDVPDASDAADAPGADGASDEDAASDAADASAPELPDAYDAADAPASDASDANDAATASNSAGASDASDAADAAYYQSGNQTNSADVPSSDNPDQVAATSKVASHRSKRNCVAHKRRHQKTLGN